MRSLACLLLLALTSTAHADGSDPDKKCDSKVEVHKERQAGRDVWVAKVIICGHAPAPGVAFVPVARSINYEWESLRQVFLPSVIRSVEKAPF